MMRRLGFLIFLIAVVAGWTVRIGSAEPDGPARKIAVGSKNFTESRLLAEIMAQLVEAHTDIRVERRVNLGGTVLAFTALRTGEIDVYPEYTGTGWSVQLERKDRVNDALRAYSICSGEFRRRFDIEWLVPFGFNNSYEIAMGEERAGALGITKISDIRAHEKELRAGLSHEFLNREDGYPGLAKAYGLDLGDVRGVEHGLAYEAIATGRTDLIDTYTTDGKLLRFSIRILEDDRHFFPPYDGAPIIRMETLRKYPELREILNRLGYRIDDGTMRQLNFRVEEEGGAFEDVARDFLRSEGLIGDETRSSAGAERPSGLAAFLWSRRAETLGYIAQHLRLTLIAMLLAILVAVPLGILLTRFPGFSTPVIGASGVIQTVPSLALLALMIPVPGLGLGARSAVAALFLYALLPILRNTFTGIREVNADLLEAARGIGLTDFQILKQVELPLATRTIMAGIRTSAVISIGVATLAAFIGAGGLGDPILTGLQLNDVNMILSGAVPAAALALVVDLLLGAVEKLLVPAGLD